MDVLIHIFFSSSYNFSMIAYLFVIWFQTLGRVYDIIYKRDSITGRKRLALTTWNCQRTVLPSRAFNCTTFVLKSCFVSRHSPYSNYPICSRNHFNVFNFIGRDSNSSHTRQRPDVLRVLPQSCGFKKLDVIVFVLYLIFPLSTRL